MHHHRPHENVLRVLETLVPQLYRQVFFSTHLEAELFVKNRVLTVILMLSVSLKISQRQLDVRIDIHSICSWNDILSFDDFDIDVVLVLPLLFFLLIHIYGVPSVLDDVELERGEADLASSDHIVLGEPVIIPHAHLNDISEPHVLPVELLIPDGIQSFHLDLGSHGLVPYLHLQVGVRRPPAISSGKVFALQHVERDVEGGVRGGLIRKLHLLHQRVQQLQPVERVRRPPHVSVDLN
mmetsp:Transcript_45927/g.144082  ORF Transcript_45927/g.144082 Transcript_45927/m.144082 type:complete len:238 (-) Transcript_45927:1807-2520(-)